MSETHDRTADELEQDLNHQLGNTGYIIQESTERQPVPSGHAPRLKSVQHPDMGGLIVAERESGTKSGAWLKAEQPVEAVR